MFREELRWLIPQELHLPFKHYLTTNKELAVFFFDKKNWLNERKY